jgi:hypothetical protein
MNSQRIFGMLLFCIGVVLFIFGLRATDSVVEGINEGLTGTYTDKTTWYLLGGLAMALVGGAMAFLGSRKVRSA